MGLGLDILFNWLYDFSECWFPTCKMKTSISPYKSSLGSKRQAPGRHRASGFVCRLCALNKNCVAHVYALGSPIRAK